MTWWSTYFSASWFIIHLCNGLSPAYCLPGVITFNTLCPAEIYIQIIKRSGALHWTGWLVLILEKWICPCFGGQFYRKGTTVNSPPNFQKLISQLWELLNSDILSHYFYTHIKHIFENITFIAKQRHQSWWPKFWLPTLVLQQTTKGVIENEPKLVLSNSWEPINSNLVYSGGVCHFYWYPFDKRTKSWNRELILATSFGKPCTKVTTVGIQNCGNQLWFCTRLLQNKFSPRQKINEENALANVHANVSTFCVSDNVLRNFQLH